MKKYLYPGLTKHLLCAFLAAALLINPCPLTAAEESSEEALDETAFILEEIQTILDTTIITASRTGTTLGKSTRSIGLVTRQDMEEAQDYSIPKMVDNVPGVILREEGGPGQLKHILIRGMSDDYTQMQFNGIPLKDPSDAIGSLYYSYTNFYSGLNVENIEVLKGANSTLYGSQAVGGVVNIAPEKWMEGVKYEDRTEFGEHRTLIKQNRVAFGNGDYYADVSLHLIDTDGDDNGGENDFYYKNKGFSATFGKQLSDDITLEFHSLYYDAEAPEHTLPEIDENGDFGTSYASEDSRDYRFSQTALLLTHKVAPAWDYIFKAAYTDSLMESGNPYGDMAGQGKDSGNTTYVELQNNFYPAPWLTVAAGIDYEKNKATIEYNTPYYESSNRYNMETWDLFILAKTAFFDESLLIDAGARYSDPDDFDAEESWELSAAYIFYGTGTKIFGHAGTGFRMPSFNEASWGIKMESEKAFSYDVGVEQSFFKRKLRLGATWYKTRIEDTIASENSGEKKSNGVEGFIELAPCRYFGLNAAYTYTDTKNKFSSSEDWQKNNYMYLPRNKINMTASFYPTDRITAQVKFLWMDEVDINSWTSDGPIEWAEDNPVITDIAVTYKILDNTDIWIRVTNLFDEDYTSMSFTMPGRWILGGVKFSF